MLKDAVAIVDIGAYSLTAMIGENGINNNFTIRAMVESEHDAFDGGVINEQSLYNALTSSLRSVANSAKARLDTVYVGVPSMFLNLITTGHRTFFNRKKRIREKDLKEFFDGACKGLYTGGYEIISRTGVCYYTDGGLRCEEILGMVTTSLSSYVSVYCGRNDFLSIVRDILATLKVTNVKFIPVPLAEGNLLFSNEERRSDQILLDVGYVSTGLTVLAGDGVLFEKSFDFGGAYVAAYLYKKYNIDYDVAERLGRKINLSIQGDVGDYVVLYGDSQYTYPVREVNEIARYVLDMIAENVDKALLNSKVRLPHNVAVSLTGGGISHIRGGAEYLSNRLEMPVNVVSPKIAYMAKPEDSSVLSVLNYALNKKMY